ncbi:Rdx family-domain-containing protein [Auriculariales sp. MPI-PUGE-AT-0066]|nr:Rdx family-domain-containing protein [Auriculariales sp. MPI-PUGE-AT-0066]
MSATEAQCDTCGPDGCQHQASLPTAAAETEAVAPEALPFPRVTIEFCDRCRWLHRAQWTATELALTFPTPVIKAITIVPLSDATTAGRFRVWLTPSEEGTTVLAWCRKRDGGFPELKVLKQKIRDVVQPGVSLGHSDTKAVGVVVASGTSS